MEARPQVIPRSAVRPPADGGESSWFRGLTVRVLGRPAPLDERERLRADMVLAFGLGFVVFGGLIVLATYVAPLPSESRSLARVTTPTFMAGMALSVLCLRCTGSVPFAAQIANASIFAVVGLSVALHGGLQSPVLCVWALLPIVAGLLAGRRSAVFWSAAIVVFLLGLDQAERAGWYEPRLLDPAVYLPSLIANMTIACAAAAAAVVLYETINANLRRSLEAERSKLRHAAGHDPLTDLPNRRLFEELQDQALRRADRTRQKVALVVLDLDGFKPVNDAFGHASGDRVLRAVADCLRGFTRMTDSIARLGGDEFAVLVELLENNEGAEVFAGRLQEALSLRVPVDRGAPVLVTASIGVAALPRPRCNGRRAARRGRRGDVRSQAGRRRPVPRVPVAPPALSLDRVEAIQGHDLRPRVDEVPDERLPAVVGCVDLRDGAQLGVGAEDEVDRRRGSTAARRWSDPDPRRGPSDVADFDHFVDMSSRFTKKSLLRLPGRSVRTPCRTPPAFASRLRMPPTSTVISRHGQREQTRAVDQHHRRGRPIPVGVVVAESVRRRLQNRERVDVRLRLRRVRAARREGHLDLEAGVLRRLLDRGRAAQHDQVGERDPVGAEEAPVEVPLPNLLERRQHLRELCGIVDGPVLLRCEAQARAVGPAAQVGAAKARRRRPGRAHELRMVSPDARIADFSEAMSSTASIKPVIHRRGWGPARQEHLPAGTSVAEIALDRGPMSRCVSLNHARANAIGELVRILA